MDKSRTSHLPAALSSNGGTKGERYSQDEAIDCAAEDWASDSRDGQSMSRELFMDAIFQLADL